MVTRGDENPFDTKTVAHALIQQLTLSRLRIHRQTSRERRQRVERTENTGAVQQASAAGAAPEPAERA